MISIEKNYYDEIIEFTWDFKINRIFLEIYKLKKVNSCWLIDNDDNIHYGFSLFINTICKYPVKIRRVKKGVYLTHKEKNITELRKVKVLLNVARFFN